MECSVFDTWVTKKDGKQMHFDIIVPTQTEEVSVLEFGKTYLNQKNQGGQLLNTQNCQFCHIEQASQEIEQSIKEKGYYILEMQGCN